MSFADESRNPAYANWAEKESKAYIGFFLFTCIAFAVFGTGHLGWLWFLVVPLGMIAASIVGGLFSITSKYLEYRRILILPHLIALGGIVAVIGLTWWSLSRIAH
jgi:hypothetical protein